MRSGEGKEKVTTRFKKKKESRPDHYCVHITAKSRVYMRSSEGAGTHLLLWNFIHSLKAILTSFFIACPAPFRKTLSPVFPFHAILDGW